MITSLPKVNLARGPRHSTVAHVGPIGPCGQWCAPNSPPKVPLPVDQLPNPTTCLRFMNMTLWHEQEIHNTIYTRTKVLKTQKLERTNPLKPNSSNYYTLP